MTVNSYLTNLANTAVIRNAEKQSIEKSISTLNTRIASCFAGELNSHFLFGSYPRNTILPRLMDEKSDVDYMIVFEDSSCKPQTYLDKLRRFANRYYSKSEILQSHPTIVLSLNHIKFELVPAVRTFWFSGLKIPSKENGTDDWINTDPNDFNADLSRINAVNDSLIKPTIRVLKYWNAKNGYPFLSFELEKMLVEKSWLGVGTILAKGQIKDYFFEAVESLDSGWFPPKYKKEAVDRAHQLVKDARYYLRYNDEDEAQKRIQRLVPPPGIISKVMIGGI